MELPEINSNVHDQLIFKKDTKAIQYRKKGLFNKWKTNICPRKKRALALTSFIHKN